MAHTKDSDCTVDPETMLCSECGVDHSDSCPDCGGWGFHKDACHAMLPQSPMDILFSDPSSVSARAVLWDAANYIYANQLGDHSRVMAMDLLDNLRRSINA